MHTYEELKQIVADRIREVITMSDGSFENAAIEVMEALFVALSEPTEAMIDAYSNRCNHQGGTAFVNVNGAWHDMLSVSPISRSSDDLPR